jgi:hypothetical protein
VTTSRTIQLRLAGSSLQATDLYFFLKHTKNIQKTYKKHTKKIQLVKIPGSCVHGRCLSEEQEHICLALFFSCLAVVFFVEAVSGNVEERHADGVDERLVRSPRNVPSQSGQTLHK